MDEIEKTQVTGDYGVFFQHRAAALRLVERTHKAVVLAKANEHAAVAQARRLGCTWQDIGTATGTTRQGAHDRWASKLKGLVRPRDFS